MYRILCRHRQSLSIENAAMERHEEEKKMNIRRRLENESFKFYRVKKKNLPGFHILRAPKYRDSYTETKK